MQSRDYITQSRNFPAFPIIIGYPRIASRIQSKHVVMCMSLAAVNLAKSWTKANHENFIP